MEKTLMNILFLNDYRKMSGAERFIELLMNDLINNKIYVELRTFYPLQPKLNDLNKFDVIHVNNYQYISKDTQKILLGHADKTVFTVHDYLYLCARRNGLIEEGYLCPFFGEFKEVCHNCVSYSKSYSNFFLPKFIESFPLVFPSSRMENIYNKYLSIHDTTFIYHGIPIIPKLPGNSSTNLLFTGRLLIEKGIYELLSAFRSVHAIYPNVKLILSNSGEHYPKVVETIERMNLQNVIHVLNRVSREELNQLYTSSRCVIAPSIWEEPFNFTVIEAYSYGKPVLASDIGGHSEIVFHEQTGLLHDPLNSEQLADNMFMMIELTPMEIRDYSHDTWDLLTKKFTIERMTNDYMKIYEGL